MNIKALNNFCLELDEIFKTSTYRKYSESAIDAVKTLYPSLYGYTKEEVEIKIKEMENEGTHANLAFDFDNNIPAISDEERDNIINGFCISLKKENIELQNDFNTYSGMFVCCCNFIQIYAINRVVSDNDALLNRLCAIEKNIENREFLYFVGNGIFMRENNSKQSLEWFSKAIEKYPDNEISLLYDFVIQSHYCEPYYNNITHKDISLLYSKLPKEIKEIVFNKYSKLYLPSYKPEKCSDKEDHMFDIDFSYNSMDNIILRKQMVLINKTLYIDNDSFGNILDVKSKLTFITDELLKMKKCKQDILAKLVAEEDYLTYEREISQLINELSSKANEMLDDSSIEELVEDLKDYFGMVWDKLNDYTKKSLKSAAFFMKSCNNLSDDVDMDFSGLCISASSALECEIKRVLYFGYKSYCKSNQKPIPSHIADRNDISQYMSPHSFTLGSVFYFFNNSRSEIDNSTLSDYLKSILIDEKICEDPIRLFTSGGSNSFASHCKEIVNNYRNPAAHIENINRDKAQNCYYEVIGRTMGEEYIENVKGILKQFYEYIDINKVLPPR